jgi:hypothetical protein
MRSVAKDLRAAFGNLSDMVPLPAVTAAIKAGNNPAGAINFNHFREVLKAPFGRLTKLRIAGAEIGERKINGTFAQAGRVIRYRKDVADRFTFDSTTPKAQQATRDAQDRLIQQLDDDSRSTIAVVIANGERTGATAEDMAADIRDVIGLTDTQAQAVLNYQQMLYDLNPDALRRQLRNAEYDDDLQDAIDSGEDLSASAIGDMVDSYIDNYLDYRAATIAQTESTRAANLGLHDAYSQAVDRGAIPEEAITRQWQLGDAPCPICESIPDNNPDGVGLDDDFDSDDGPVSDPPVHPSCECSVDYVTDLTQVPDDGE